jgi:hypothetical protein
MKPGVVQAGGQEEAKRKAWQEKWSAEKQAGWQGFSANHKRMNFGRKIRNQQHSLQKTHE